MIWKSEITHKNSILFCASQKGNRGSKSSFFEQGLNNISLEEKSENLKRISVSLKPPPAPSSTVSPVHTPCSSDESQFKNPFNTENKEASDAVDDDFGDFQAAG